MQRAIEIVRVLCGCLVILCGLMNLGLFGFTPPEATGEGRQFQLAMHSAGYFLPIITVTFILAGTAVVSNRFGALGTLLVVPISVNIVLFHTALGGGQSPVAIIFFAANCFLLWYYRAAYRSLLVPRVNSSQEWRLSATKLNLLHTGNEGQQDQCRVLQLYLAVSRF